MQFQLLYCANLIHWFLPPEVTFFQGTVSESGCGMGREERGGTKGNGRKGWRFLQRVGLANSGQVMSERIQGMEFLILLGKRSTLLQKCNLWDSFPGGYFEFFFFNFRTPVLSSLFDFVCLFLPLCRPGLPWNSADQVWLWTHWVLGSKGMCYHRSTSIGSF